MKLSVGTANHRDSLLPGGSTGLKEDDEKRGILHNRNPGSFHLKILDYIDTTTHLYMLIINAFPKLFSFIPKINKVFHYQEINLIRHNSRDLNQVTVFVFVFWGILGSAARAEFPVSPSNHGSFPPRLLYSNLPNNSPQAARR